MLPCINHFLSAGIDRPGSITACCPNTIFFPHSQDWVIQPHNMQKIGFLTGIPRVKSFGTWFDSSPVSTHPAAPRLHGPGWLPMSHSEVHWWGFGQLWFAALPIVPHHPRLCSLYWPKLIKLHMKATAEPLTSTMKLFLGTSYSTCVWSCILHWGLSSSPQGCS